MVGGLIGSPPGFRQARVRETGARRLTMGPAQHHFGITGFEAADALFVSALQCSQAPCTDQVRQAIDAAVGAFGYSGAWDGSRRSSAIPPRPRRPGCAGPARRWRPRRSACAWLPSRPGRRASIPRPEWVCGPPASPIGACVPQAPNARAQPLGHVDPGPVWQGPMCHEPQARRRNTHIRRFRHISVVDPRSAVDWWRWDAPDNHEARINHGNQSRPAPPRPRAPV